MDIRLSIFILIATTLLVSGWVAGSRSGLPVDTAKFVERAAIHNIFEIRSGHLAALRAINPDLRDFAAETARDHEEIDQRLRSAVISSGLELSLPEMLDEAHHVRLSTLDRFEGDSFDRRYITMLEDSHDIAIRFFNRYKKRGEDQALLEFAEETLPQLVEHRQEVDDIKSRL